jgi:hypothetical protein
MESCVIAFIIPSKKTTLQIHQPLKNYGLIALRLITVTKWEVDEPIEFILKSTEDSLYSFDPISFKTKRPIIISENNDETFENTGICYLKNTMINCKKVKLELIVIPPPSKNDKFDNWAHLSFKVFGDDNNYTDLPEPYKLLTLKPNETLKTKMTSEDIATLINDFKTKHKQGFTKLEIQILLKKITKISYLDFSRNLARVTCMIINDEVITYKHDLRKAVMMCINKRELEPGEWD